MRPGDLVQVVDVWIVLWDKPSDEVWTDPGAKGQLITNDICLVVDVCEGKSLYSPKETWYKILGPRNLIGWTNSISFELMDD